LAVFRQKEQWRTLMTNAMAADYSWDRSAREYSNLYVNLVQGTGAPAGLLRGAGFSPPLEFGLS
jgi:hypothetical protein